jgi:hypothetical protein
MATSDVKSFACGCERTVSKGALGGWVRACPNHELASIWAEKALTFPVGGQK